MQVQSTNDSSIVSKLSSAKKNYFQDDYLQMFVDKVQTRSPIINRGYYIRFRAIETAFQTWFSSLSTKPDNICQVVSLGAGFDSSYFRLKCQNMLPSGSKYIEIDFPEVMQRKFECLKLHKYFPFPKKTEKDPNIVTSLDDYFMLGIDLKDYNEIEKCFKNLEIDFSIPTLFLSECATTYMDFKSSNSLIRWIQMHFENSAFVAYEQVLPDDAFGIVMQNHFNSLGCPLKSLIPNANKEKQVSRFKNLGWHFCACMNMLEFHYGLSTEEKKRVESLEMFDEYEMWHEKCRHYVLIWACQGEVLVPPFFNNKSSEFLGGDSTESIKELCWNCVPSHKLLQRYGHQVVQLSSNIAIVSGGFGPHEKRHQRLAGLITWQLSTNCCSETKLCDDQNILGKRMYHTMTKLCDGTVIIIGGRLSPSKTFGDVLALKLNTDITSVLHDKESVSNSLDGSIMQFCVEKKCDMPLATWRHSAALIEKYGSEAVAIFGGCSVKAVATNACYILHPENWTWFEVQHQTHTPSERHSHSSVTIHKNKVLITGGLSEDEKMLNSAYLLDCGDFTWSPLNIVGLLPRYSHTSHVWRDRIYLVGGITSSSNINLGICIIDLQTLAAAEFAAPSQDPEYPLLLSGHCSLLNEDKIIFAGGGGNCFSFGTHFNAKSAIIDLLKF